MQSWSATQGGSFRWSWLGHPCRCKIHYSIGRTCICGLNGHQKPRSLRNTSISEPVQEMPKAQNEPLTAEEMNEFREVFDLMDRDKGGSLNTDEVRQLMELLGMRVRQDELELTISELDGDGNGDIGFDEFVQVMAKKAEVPYTKADVMRAFRMFADPDAPPGCIGAEALEKALLKYGRGKVADAEILRLVSSLDLNDGGWIDFKSKTGQILDA